MALKDILVYLDVASTTDKAPEVAMDLATRFDAHVTGLAYSLEPVAPPVLMGPVPTDLLSQAAEQAENAAQAAINRFATLGERYNARYEQRVLPLPSGKAAENFANQGRLTDLVVIGQEDPDNGDSIKGGLIESALFETARPVLIVPYIDKELLAMKRVQVAWDGSRAAARAVRAALPILEAAGQAEIVMVDNGKLANQVDPGADLAIYLSRHDIKVEITRIPGQGISVGDALLSYAYDKSADLLVMGGYGHSRMREFILGGATRDILRSMTVPVLMAH